MKNNKSKRVAIIGLGMLGTSLGMALSKNNAYAVSGFDLSQQTQKRAQSMGAIDKSHRSIKDAALDADIVVISTPPIQAYRVMETLADNAKPQTTILDTLTVNAPTNEWAKDVLVNHFPYFISSNPLTGSSLGNQEHADISIFKGKPWIISPNPVTEPKALKAVEDIIRSVGSTPLFMDADENDSFVAATAGMPAVIAVALMQSVTQSNSWQYIHKFIDVDFDQLTRCLNGDPALTGASAGLNGDMIAIWIDIFIKHLQILKEALTDYTNSLNPNGKWLSSYIQAWENRAMIDAGVSPTSKHNVQSKLPGATETLGSLMFGRPIYESLFRLYSTRNTKPFKYNRDLL